jgi:hypothetical protein
MKSNKLKTAWFCIRECGNIEPWVLRVSPNSPSDERAGLPILALVLRETRETDRVAKKPEILVRWPIYLKTWLGGD